VDASDITIGFDNNYTYFYNDTYADAYGNFVGETVTKGRTKYDVYPINLTTAGLTAWKVIITGGSADTQLTCTRSDISGLTSVYNNGYFFLPTGETPLNTEFTLEGMVNCTIDTDAKTITAQYDPSIGITADGVVVTQGYQTTGQGNENALLLRMDVTPLKNITNTTLTVTLDATTQQNISSLYVYETTATEFIANIPSTKLATDDDISGTVSINLGDVSSGLHHYWLCATVKDDATLGDILDAALTSITYTTTEEKTLDVSEIGNPTRQGMKMFAQQNFVFKPTADNCRFYRIPAMILDKNGNVVVAIDRRYNSNADLGSHKIDVSVVRSTDAGKTWSNQNIVAVGNTSIEARYGYGDAALARTQSGKLICLMAPGQNNFFGTNHNGSTHYNNWVAMLTSNDNGMTWQGTSDNPTQPILLTNDVFGMGTDHSIFVSSGKGLTTADGTVMFTTNVRMPDGTLNCYILKTTDEGASWTLVPEVAYSGTDESKLEQLSDGRLILSVRQSGNRGWNFGDSDGTGWGTQYRSEDIWGNACNADIINYGREMNLGKDVLIHSYINTGGRESLQLAISINGGSSWTGVYNIQPNGSCYSTMQILSDGSLAILYEDESYSAGNGYAINYVTITKDQVEAWIQELDQADYDFDANFDKTFIIKNYNAANGNKQYIRSAKYNDANDLNVYRTTDLEESAEMVILKDHQNEGFYYVYDVKSNYYLKGSANTNAGTAWTFSTTPVTVKLTDHTSSHNWSLTDGHIFIIQNSEGSMANAYEGIYGNQVKNWTDDTDAGSHWYIYATDNSSTSSVYIDPTALYYVKNVDNGCCFETGEDGNLTRNTQATAATYAIIPVSGQTGKFYLYDTKAKNFVVSEETTGNGGQWTRSTTSPTPIPIRNNITNQYMNRSQWNPSGIIYLLGSKYANRYGGGITGLVKNYDAQSDKGSHWYLERVDNSTPAIVEMNGITDNVRSLVESGVTDGTKLQYTAKLNTVGETSWATLYVPFNLTLPENTSAY
ncbi:MAG: exo-alpha-sialidase, partial [Prevotella sp.]|nr:exo-alpha-sialidase [Prevotella sp.]